MDSHIEREIKLHYTSHDNACLAVERLKGTLLRDRRLQDDYLLDLPDGDLKPVSYTHLTLPTIYSV